MKLDIFSEIQKRDCDAMGGSANCSTNPSSRRAWPTSRVRLLVGVEHHCTPDFSYSSCPN
jgi:hypothetical protein